MSYFDTLKKQILHDIAALPTGRRRVALALIGGSKARTYRQVAELLGVHVGTVYRHLGRIRQHHPEIYEALMAYRKAQLEVRHVEALKRAEAHSRRYFRRKANYRYRQLFGRWPWERW